MNQTRWESFQEAIHNVIVGYLFGLTMQLVFFPVAGVEVAFSTNLELSLYFTLASVTRTYLLRRYHNWKLKRRHERARP